METSDVSRLVNHKTRNRFGTQMSVKRPYNNLKCVLTALSILLIVAVFYFSHFEIVPQRTYQPNTYPKYKGSVDTDLKIERKPSPGYVTRLRSGILQLERNLSRWMADEDIGVDMVQRALKHVQSTRDLQRVISRAVRENKPLHVGIAGGSISAVRYCYGNILTEAIEAALGVPVVLHNEAVGATDSRYFAYCFGSLLNIHQLDIVLWEFAANDFIKNVGPWAQEEFTRVITDLPNQPQLIFVNFLHGLQMKSESPCLNNEKIGSEPLSEYYDIPSISMPDALCPVVKTGQYKDWLKTTDNHPSEKSHNVMAIFLVEFFRQTLQNLSNTDIIENDVKPIPRERNTVKPLFANELLIMPKCWTFMRTIESTRVQLKPVKAEGWQIVSLNKNADITRTDIKMWWESSIPQSKLVFNINIAPYKNLNSTIAIAMYGCPQCGKADIYIDGEKAATLTSAFAYRVTLTKTICESISPGTHSLTFISKTGRHFQLAAIMTSHRIYTP